MYLSNRDIKWAIESGKLIVDPPPSHFKCGFDETSIDLHLDGIDHAKVWNVEKHKDHQRKAGNPAAPFLYLGEFEWENFSGEFLMPVPNEPTKAEDRDNLKVYRRGNEIIVKPGGFMLWTTMEVVGTPKENPELIAFVNAKSTKARTGVLVHFTAPTIHSGWKGKIALEIANLGPFVFILRPNDAIAQLTVATISSRPDPDLRKKKSVTIDQDDPGSKTTP
jgi:deoxycytidine triphosphate deaminase